MNKLVAPQLATAAAAHSEQVAPPVGTPPLAVSLRAVWALCAREMIRFFRQRNRIVGSIGTPVMFWLLFGAGLQRTFVLPTGGASGAPAQSFLQYYFPGSLVLILLFTAIFASISIIEDRREGFLQSVLVAPIPRWSMVLGKLLGGTLIALFQGLIFLLLALTLQVRMSPLTFLELVVLLTATSLALTGLGFVIAWRMDSTQGFHAVMNLVLMPLWLLSGGFFPTPALGPGSSVSDYLLSGAMRINPLSYSVAGVRELLYGPLQAPGIWMPSLATCWIATIAFAAVMFVSSVAIARERTTGDLL
jgi:ABC-2 type transport system permease protein